VNRTDWLLVIAGFVAGGVVSWASPPWVGAALFLSGAAAWIAVRIAVRRTRR
jgi:hypothetical protein